MSLYCEADIEESIRRMREIDEIRAAGGQTECEKLGTQDIRMKVINARTKEVKKYPTIKSACIDNGVKYWIIQERFKRSRSKKILYNGLIFRKVDENK